MELYAHDMQRLGPLWAAFLSAVTGTHYYFSTACLHGAHDYCAADVGVVSAKRPHTCKFCAAHRCRCACHAKSAATLPE